MSNQQNLTQEEVNAVQDLRGRIANNVQAIGRLNVRKHFLNLESSALDQELSNIYRDSEDLSAEEDRLVGGLKQKYGEGSFDFNAGVFIPSGHPDENPTPESEGQ